MSQACSASCPLSETLIAEIARLTGVSEDVVRVAHGLPVHHAQARPPKRVVLETPHGADAGYARAAFADSVLRGEAPIFSSALQGTEAALDEQASTRVHEIWAVFAETTVVYADLGITSGMQHAVDRARLTGRPVEIRELGAPWLAQRRRHTSVLASTTLGT